MIGTVLINHKRKISPFDKGYPILMPVYINETTTGADAEEDSDESMNPIVIVVIVIVAVAVIAGILVATKKKNN